jgi:hypothetical protein
MGEREEEKGGAVVDKGAGCGRNNGCGRVVHRGSSSERATTTHAKLLSAPRKSPIEPCYCVSTLQPNYCSGTRPRQTLKRKQVHVVMVQLAGIYKLRAPTTYN